MHLPCLLLNVVLSPCSGFFKKPLYCVCVWTLQSHSCCSPLNQCTGQTAFPCLQVTPVLATPCAWYLCRYQTMDSVSCSHAVSAGNGAAQGRILMSEVCVALYGSVATIFNNYKVTAFFVRLCLGFYLRFAIHLVSLRWKIPDLFSCAWLESWISSKHFFLVEKPITSTKLKYWKKSVFICFHPYDPFALLQPVLNHLVPIFLSDSFDTNGISEKG